MALIDNQKSQFCIDVRAMADLMALVRERCRSLDQKWASLGFGSGGTNVIIQADIDAVPEFSGLLVAELTACVTTAQGFETWFNAGHEDNIEKIRK